MSSSMQQAVDSRQWLVVSLLPAARHLLPAAHCRSLEPDCI